MILIITHKSDFTADYVVNQLNARNIPYKRFNCEDLFIDSFSCTFNHKFVYEILHQADYEAIWYRRVKLPPIANNNPEERNYILGEAHAFLQNLFSLLSGKWLSDPIWVNKAENKLYQLKIAAELGFLLPDTLVTNSKSKLIQFFQKHNGSIVIKPLSHTRVGNDFIFTNLVTETYIDQIDEYDLTPSIFQQYVHKDHEVRVTVVDGKVFSAAVDSQSEKETRIDWRKKKLLFAAVELPIQIQNLCVELVKRLGLHFGAIDLIKDVNGNYIFLEINPNGQWVWIEQQTGLNISNAIIEYLTST